MAPQVQSQEVEPTAESVIRAPTAEAEVAGEFLWFAKRKTSRIWDLKYVKNG